MSVPLDLLAFAVALAGSLLLTVPVRRLALHYGMVDLPGPRKVHLSPIPLLGGIAIYLGFVLAILFTLRGAPHQQMAGILAGATLLAVVGLLEQMKLGPLPADFWHSNNGATCSKDPSAKDIKGHPTCDMAPN